MDSLNTLTLIYWIFKIFFVICQTGGGGWGYNFLDLFLLEFLDLSFYP